MKPRNPARLMQRGPELIAPAGLRLIAGSLLAAVLLSLLPWPRAGLWLVPEFPLMVLLYWNTHEPRRTPLRLAFGLGLLADVGHGVLFGIHALAYLAASFLALMVQRRLANFGPYGQALQLAPIFLGMKLLIVLLGLAMTQGVADWRQLAGGLVAALLWLPMCLLLNRLAGRPDEPPSPGS
ncbi:MAG TPA: rod shape-determining protein MreD [Thiobacillaceae bacterium]|nr:rod shape-determining protein MreD [Thiobacillaceae bacterium]